MTQEYTGLNHCGLFVVGSNNHVELYDNVKAADRLPTKHCFGFL